MAYRALNQRIPHLRRLPVVVSRAHASTSTAPARPDPSSSSPAVKEDRIDPKTLVLGPQSPQRMEARYRHIESDLLYLLYDPHMPADLPDPIVHIPLPNPDNPYEANRHLVRPKGGHLLRPNAKPVSPFTLPKLQKIVFHSYVKEAAHNKSALVPAIAAARAISGSTREGGNIPGLSGVQLVYSRRSLPTWRLREGVAIGVKVEMRGEQMWAFLNSLIEFVIPRMRDFKGFALPTSSSSPNTPNNISGTVSVGFPPTAMGLFPQIEINFDNYPRMYGFHVQFVTDQRGKGAQDRARQLMSAFRIPFVRR